MAKRHLLRRFLVALVLLALGLTIGWLTDPMPAKIGRMIFQSRVLGQSFGRVMVTPSPDGSHIAYAQEQPASLTTQQVLEIERADKSRYVSIAELPEDIEHLQQIVWSP